MMTRKPKETLTHDSYSRPGDKFEHASLLTSGQPFTKFDDPVSLDTAGLPETVQLFIAGCVMSLCSCTSLLDPAQCSVLHGMSPTADTSIADGFEQGYQHVASYEALLGFVCSLVPRKVLAAYAFSIRFNVAFLSLKRSMRYE